MPVMLITVLNDFRPNLIKMMRSYRDLKADMIDPKHSNELVVHTRQPTNNVSSVLYQVTYYLDRIRTSRAESNRRRANLYLDYAALGEHYTTLLNRAKTDREFRDSLGPRA